MDGIPLFVHQNKSYLIINSMKQAHYDSVNEQASVAMHELGHDLGLNTAIVLIPSCRKLPQPICTTFPKLTPSIWRSCMRDTGEVMGRHPVLDMSRFLYKKSGSREVASHILHD